MHRHAPRVLSTRTCVCVCVCPIDAHRRARFPLATCATDRAAVLSSRFRLRLVLFLSNDVPFLSSPLSPLLTPPVLVFRRSSATGPASVRRSNTHEHRYPRCWICLSALLQQPPSSLGPSLHPRLHPREADCESTSRLPSGNRRGSVGQSKADCFDRGPSRASTH